MDTIRLESRQKSITAEPAKIAEKMEQIILRKISHVFLRAHSGLIFLRGFSVAPLVYCPKVLTE